MKYRDSDIILVRTNRIYRFENLLPNNDYIFLKVLEDNTILSSRGKLSKKLFGLKNRNLINKNLKDIKIELFNDYIFNLKHKASLECGAYQFVFQYKDVIEPYICSIYPCILYDKCKSFDIVIRQNDSNELDQSFFTML